MYKSVVLFCIACALVEARPKWQFLPPVPGYVPVYIRTGDTPLEEINPDLAEAFHALPAGRSAGKQLDAEPDIPERTDQAIPEQADLPIPEQADLPIPEQADQPIPDVPEITNDARGHIDTPYVTDEAYNKRVLEKKLKKATFDIPKPIERR